TAGGFRPDVPQYQIPSSVMQSRLRGLSSGEKHHTAGLAALDQHVGVVMETLEQLGCLDDTLIIFTADHGVEPGKSSVYRFGNHVPLIMRWPKKIPPGSVSDQLVAHVDLLVTLTKIAGLSLPEEQVFDGVDLSPLFTRPDTRVRETVYTEMGHVRAVYDGRYQYVTFRYPERVIEAMQEMQFERAPNHLGYQQVHAAFTMAYFSGYFDPDQLYDLQKDPFQLQNRWKDPELAAARDRLRERLFEYTDTFDHAFPEEPNLFFATDTYKQLVDAALSKETPETEWELRDLDRIAWPPIR
ncbi:MAG: sulfatase/phosphatase domain-containing protein, partial [Verrucomicrobiota bacterium]